MSRKTAQKSNIPPIGIFEGKEAEYNKRILETLLASGRLTTWEIAKRICNHKYPHISDFELEARSRHVYSTIQRKKGRLQDLKAKGYIIVKGKKWELSLKGITAVLILEPSLIRRIHSDYLTVRFGPNQEDVTIGPFKVKGICSEDGSRPSYDIAIDPQGLLRFANKTGKYLNEGIVNLDKISEDKLQVLVGMELADDGRFSG